MKFHATPLQGAYTIELEKRGDDRGFFARFFCEKEFEAAGVPLPIVQINNSLTEKAGTLRGMHYQLAPAAEIKVVRCIRGALYDAIVDLRPNSPTFGKWYGAELTAENRLMIVVPMGLPTASLPSPTTPKRSIWPMRSTPRGGTRLSLRRPSVSAWSGRRVPVVSLPKVGSGPKTSIQPFHGTELLRGNGREKFFSPVAAPSPACGSPAALWPPGHTVVATLKEKRPATIPAFAASASQRYSAWRR